MQIFLAPRSNETSYKNFLSSIENGVDYQVVEPYLGEEGKKVLSSQGKLLVWGNKETKRSSWEKMETEDLVLIYKGREGSEKEGKFIYAGRLLYKQYSRELGLALWPPKPGEEPWICIFFLTNFQPIYMPISVIIDFSNYSKGFVVQGLMPLKEEAVKKIVQKFGSIDQFLGYYTSSALQQKPDLEIIGKRSAHTQAQLMILKIGKMLGYDTYSPNKSADVSGESLRDYITLDSIPQRFLGSELIPLVKEIDVIWYEDEVPRFAFEIEHTTKFVNGFQRLGQLTPLSTKLFIISSEDNHYLFDKFINTDPYYKTKSSYRFRSYKQLEDYFRSVSELSAINNAFLEK